MNKYKKTVIVEGALRTSAIKEIPTEHILDRKKGAKRKEINEEIFDIDDSVADNSKMISLLLSILNNIYSALPADAKANIQDKEVIESVLSEFNSKANFSTKLSTEGAELAQKLFDRQEQISTIVKK
jgi:uncharacterized protein YeeX (DUF496 family)